MSGCGKVSVQDVLDFWFEESGTKAWFKKDADFDARIVKQFETTVRAHKKDLESREESAWELTASGTLALILCFDQFPRNMYRGSPRAFLFDGLARRVAVRALEKHYDREIADARRSFFYMPFMHSEKLADQMLCVELTSQRLENQITAHHARQHCEVIRRFGRFPHRNQILGRPNTKEEEDFMKEGGFAP